MRLSHQRKKPLASFDARGFLRFNPGNDLVSHKVALAVPSAQRGLTSVFGMGTGVTLSIQSPETFYDFGFGIWGTTRFQAGSLNPTSEIRIPKSKNSRGP